MYSIKLNGSYHGYFAGRKGIRQGDPLSPYIFYLCMNVLSSIISKVPSSFSFHWKYKNTKITHLFYADDVLLFSRGDIDSIKHLMTSVNLFASLSGLQPSTSKSSVFFCNCQDNVRS